MKIENTSDLERILKTTKKVIIDYSAKWCMPCKKIMPVFDTLSTNYTDIEFIKIDISEFDVDVPSLPTFHFYNNGEFVNQLTEANENKLKSMTEELANMV